MSTYRRYKRRYLNISRVQTRVSVGETRVQQHMTTAKVNSDTACKHTLATRGLAVFLAVKEARNKI